VGVPARHQIEDDRLGLHTQRFDHTLQRLPRPSIHVIHASLSGVKEGVVGLVQSREGVYRLELATRKREQAFRGHGQGSPCLLFSL